VTRRKESLSFRVAKKLPKASDKRILRDDLVALKNKNSRANYRKPIRRVLALVEVDGQERETEFLTDNLSWSASSVADLYRCRWQIEVFFKQTSIEIPSGESAPKGVRFKRFSVQQRARQKESPVFVSRRNHYAVQKAG